MHRPKWWLRVRRMLDANSVLWQMAELGKVDYGGGGTIAQYMANRNIDTLDAGVPVLSMRPLRLCPSWTAT